MDKYLSEHVSWPDVINILADLVVYNQYGFQEFLKRLIAICSEIVPTDSCFIYFYDRDNKQLTLVGSKKSHDSQLGKITMHSGEGITGWVALHQQTVAIEKEAFKDSRFKPFEELPEDKYESFLSVPIVNETGVVGVVNFQNKKSISFSPEQIKTIEALVKLISSAFAKTVWERKVNSLEIKLEERKIVEKAKGILMKARNITEEEAFKLMRSEAMNKRKSMKEIAEAILLVWQ